MTKEQARKQKYYQEHREELLAYNRAYYQSHKEYFKEYGKKWRAENKGYGNKTVRGKEA